MMTNEIQNTVNEQPTEQIRFAHRADRLPNLFQSIIDRLVANRCCLSLSLAAMIVFSLAADLSIFTSGVLWGLAFTLAIYWRNIKEYRKLWQKTKINLLAGSYQWDVYSDHLICSAIRDHLITSRFRIPFSEITEKSRIKNMLVFTYRGIAFAIPEEELAADSRIRSLFQDVPSDRAVKKRAWQKALSWLLFLLSVLAVLSGIFFSFRLVPGVFISVQRWVPMVCAIIPIFTLIFGLLPERKEKIHTIIVGAVSTGLLIFVALLLCLVPQTDQNDRSYLQTVERRIQIEFPDSDWCATQETESDWSTFESEGTLYTRCRAYVEESDADNFERKILRDGRWLTSVPEKFDVISCPDNADLPDSDAYVMFYNIRDKTYNARPRMTGDYRYICVTYYPDEMLLVVSEYLIHYSEISQ
ncbi:MAG: hypothetical protein IJC85_05525 [Oscillospiraceae bacterium]|nr:hypothetical protein [Oscillospiraceae bacterium]MBQ4102327.1 hypothetical protein [Oscillospiraceae bacterium]